MKKLYGLMVGDVIIKKSEKRNELVEIRNKMDNKKAYVCTFVGRIKIKDSSVIEKKQIELFD